jgi:biofilm PGA synthesis lipoprotein PgaB
MKNFPESPELKTALDLFQKARGAKGQKTRPASSRADAPAQSADSSGTMKAVQIPLFLQSGYGEIGAEMGRLKASGLDTVIVRVFHNIGDRYYASADPESGVWNETGVYFKTDHAPVIDDVLGPLVELAHASGLKIFAWMTTRYADYGLEHRDELACTAYDLKRRKEVRCKGLDLFNEEAVEHLEALYSDLAEYAIDGVLFQDDLVLRQTEGFKGAVRAKNPEELFAINLMYESVTNPPYALAWLSQDLAAAVEVGFDYYSIMAYHRQMENELNKRPIAIRGLIGKMVEDATRTVGEPSKVLVKLQIVDWETGESVDEGEVTEILREISRSKPVSLAVVPYRDDFPYGELSTKSGVALLGRPSNR